ncbi:MAG: MotA/TolQ/ExbB proton channel family protein [Myxococcales bacterium]|nr:MotA/TolQ/ExbB proton channel family protein [Myxococcales bacterium]MCB9707523.1 MotA/TolQ/ExbB proton channel family protein [Myxococcales bacterium]
MTGGIWDLIVQASTVVKVVMALLVVLSAGTWFIVGAKLKQFGSAGRFSRRFLQLFWAKGNRGQWDAARLEHVYHQLAAYRQSPLAKMFHAGYVELARMTGTSSPHHGSYPPPRAELSPTADVQNVERALRRTAATELTQLEQHLSFLATTGSTAPFIGLFGTVWGIMNSFLAIRAKGNASLDVVGGDIAEALIATALGLAAAIPAVMAYNYFVRRLRLLENDMDAFNNDFLNIVRRHFLSR